MTNAAEKEVILKAWDISDDVAIIKDVATKGSHIEMCVAYLARKRRITLDESREYFDHHVNIYVNRLLRDKLVFKAESVLRNVGRNVEHVYFQYAFDSEDLVVQTALMQHLKRKDPDKFEEKQAMYEAYYEMLREASGRLRLRRLIAAAIGQLRLENLFQQDEDYPKQLAVEVYFETKQSKLIPLLERKHVWNFLVRNDLSTELIAWGRVFFNEKHRLPSDVESALSAKYRSWEIDEEMFAQALTIPNPTETLRNIFAANGHIFPDEKESVRKILSRIFTTESFEINRERVEKLLLARHIIEVEACSLLLEDYITCSDLESAKKHFPSKTEYIEFIIALKSSNIGDPKTLAEISRAIGRYLERFDARFYKKNAIVRLVELLGENASFDDFEKPENWVFLKHLSYLRAVLERVKSPPAATSVTMEEFVEKFKHVNFRQITENLGHQPANFSNITLSEKYAPSTKLNYFHFIRHYRSANAVYNFLLDQLQNYSQIPKVQLRLSAEIVTEMALQNSSSDFDLEASCIAYVEMLGFDTSTTRSVLKLQRFTADSNDDGITGTKLISMSEAKLFANTQSSATEFPIRLYSAIVAVTKTLESKICPELYLESIARADNWWKFLLFAQYFDIPLLHIGKLTRHFQTVAIGDHVARALSKDPAPEKSKRRPSFSRNEHRRRSIRINGDERNSQTTSGDTITSSSSSETSHLQKSRSQLKFLQELKDVDLFAIILLSASDKPEDDIATYERFIEVINDEEVHFTSLNLLKNCISYDLPVLAVLSAVVNERNVKWCWATWMLASMGIWKKYSVCSDSEEFALALIERSVRRSSVRTLHQSFQIFFPDSKFNYFSKFLLQTSEHSFDHNSIQNLRLYLLAWSNENLNLPLIESNNQNNLINFSIKLIILHLKYNFSSSYYQEKCLDIVCQSGLNEINSKINFNLLKQVVEIITFTKAKIDYEKLITNIAGVDNSIQSECQNICAYLEECKEFDKAIKLATLLTMPIADLVYAKWVYSVEECNGDTGDLEFSENERETDMYMLPPELLINFYLYVSVKSFITEKQKFHILKKALDVIKKNHLLPNEFFDRDKIEFEMIVSYLESDLTIDDLDIYHSKYYEQILLQERCVLYKSFPELKELAGVEVLKTSKIELSENMRLKFEVLLNKLLDDGDIVQALRLQAMFDHRPIDLHFIVFCMALAEGITNIYNLPNNERQLLIEVEKNALQFNKRVLGRNKGSQYGNMPSPAKQSDISESTSNLEFEEIPPREKQDVLKALQGIVSRLNHGVSIGKRIMMVYRAAMHLDKEYLDVLKTKDSLFLLRNAIEEDCLEKLVVISDIFISSQMSHHEIADFLSSEIATAVIRPRFYILNPALPTAQNILWGFNLEKEFHLFLELSSNTILLGNCLLDYCDALKTYRKYQDNKNYERDIEENSQIVNAFDNLRDIIRRYGHPNNVPATSQVLSHKKQNTIYVELLIKAHDCFVHELSMEGIANVLNRAKILNTILSTAKSWNLIVRMLTGIGRYREMYYCIETLISNDQFESLLGQFDEEKTKGLRHAVIQYIREICPQNREHYRLTALHFSMFKELAEMWETEGNSIFAKIISNYHDVDDGPTTSRALVDTKIAKKTMLHCSGELLVDLGHAVEDFTHATENYLMDNKLKLAQKSIAYAELAAMQSHLVSTALASVEETCISVLNIRNYELFRDLINNELSVPQSMILERAYSYEINWAEAILNQYVILGRNNYIRDFCNRLELNDGTIENIVKSFQFQTNITPAMEENMSNVVELVHSVSLRYKLASLLGFRKILTSLINDQSLYYLKDTNYGRNEIDFS